MGSADPLTAKLEDPLFGDLSSNCTEKMIRDERVGLPEIYFLDTYTQLSI